MVAKRNKFRASGSVGGGAVSNYDSLDLPIGQGSDEVTDEEFIAALAESPESVQAEHESIVTDDVLVMPVQDDGVQPQDAAFDERSPESEFVLMHEQNGQPLTTTATTELAALDEIVLTPIRALRPSVTTSSCVRALERAIGFGKSALYLEVAVALSVFASSSTGADRSTKRVVMEVYAQAGFDVAHTGRDYKTVHRRITASASLFNMIGKDAVIDAMHGLREAKAIDSITNYLAASAKFDSINALLEYVGKPVQQTNTPEVRLARAARSVAEDTAAAVQINSRIEARREERQKQLVEESDGIIVFSGSLSIVVPRDASPAEVRAMAEKLTEFADRMEAEIGTPEEQRNREMHS